MTPEIESVLNKHPRVLPTSLMIKDYYQALQCVCDAGKPGNLCKRDEIREEGQRKTERQRTGAEQDKRTAKRKDKRWTE